MLEFSQLSGESSVRAIKEFFNPPTLVLKARQLVLQLLCLNIEKIDQGKGDGGNDVKVL